MSEPKPAGTWDFDGACAPASREGRTFHMETFSLGIFQWVAKSSGKGTKRGKVVQRVKGRTDSPEAAFVEARRIVTALNSEGME